MSAQKRLAGLAAWLGLLLALLSLGAYQLAFGAVGVVLDTRLAGLWLAVVALVLALVGSVGGRSRRLPRAVAAVALVISILSGSLLVRDLFLLFRVEEVRFSSGEISLAGSLYLPTAGAPPHGAVVMIHGAGEETRDEGAFYARLFARSGVGALTYDKRGSGASEGDVTTATYADLAADALAAIAYLRDRSEIDADRIGIKGVSEGGWVAPLVAATDERVAFVIVASATAESPSEQVGHEVAESLRRAGYGAEIATRAADLYARLSQFERTGEGHEKLAEELRKAAEEVWFETAAYLPAKLPTFDELAARHWYPAWRSNMDFDAQVYWRQVACPVLVLLGGSDPKIDAATAGLSIREALVAGGNTEVSVTVIADAEHGLIEWWLPGRLPPPRFRDRYPSMMVDWVLESMAPGPGE